MKNLLKIFSIILFVFITASSYAISDGTISGTVKDDISLAPIKSATVNVYVRIGDSVSTDWRLDTSVSTGTNGTYSVLLKDGTYKLYVTGSHFKSEWYQDKEDIKDATSLVVVTGGDIFYAHMLVESLPTTDITGNVKDELTNEPIKSGYVDFYYETTDSAGGNWKLHSSNKIKENGNYTGLVGVGKYKLFVRGDSFQSEWYQDKDDIKDATSLVVVTGGDIFYAHMFVRSSSSDTISGFINVDDDCDGEADEGEPRLAGWKVELWNDSNVVLTTTTDANGNYVFRIYEDEESEGLARKFKVKEIVQTGYFPSNPKSGIIEVTLDSSHHSIENINFLNCIDSSDDKNCCERFYNMGLFNSAGNNQQVSQVLNELVALYGLIKVQNQQISRVSVSLVSAGIKRMNANCQGVWEPTYADFVIVGTYGNIQPASYPSTNCGSQTNLGSINGLPGPSGTFCSDYPYGRELVWGGYTYSNLMQSIDMTNGCQFESVIKFPFVTDNNQSTLCSDDSVKFSIRYQFSDSTCCTCDTLVNYVLGRNYINLPILYIDPMGKYFKMKSMTEGTITISNPTKFGDDNGFVINKIRIRCIVRMDGDKEALSCRFASIQDLTTGKTGVVTDGVAELDISLNHGEKTDIKLTYENPDNIYVIPNDINLFVKLDKAQGLPSVPVYESIYGVAPGAGGDSLKQDKTNDMNNVHTIALDFRNANKAKQGIATIELTPIKAKILTAGSMENEKRIFFNILRPKQGEVMLADRAATEPDSSFKPIYVLYKNLDSANKELRLGYKTYDENGVLLSEGELTVQPITSVKSNDGGGSGLNNGMILNDCYPNPVNGDISFSFFSPKEIGDVSLTLYDLKGIMIAKVFDNSWFGVGNHVIMYNIGGLPSGVYYYKLESEEYSETKVLNVIH